MPKPFVYVTRAFADSGIRLLKDQGCRVEVYPEEQPIPRKLLLENVKTCDALIPLLTDRIDDTVLAAGKNLKIVANYAVGFDNVDLAAAKKRNIVVTNTPSEAVNEAVAEHALALILSLTRRIVEADAFAKAKKYKAWSPTHFIGPSLAGKTLGIVGAGRIGSSLAKRAAVGLGMKIVYADSRRNSVLETETQARAMSLEKLLEVADVISLHVPLLPSTRHLISTAEFSMMKKNAYLINTARGPVVDEKALLRALRTKRIAGAALDVFECEPAIDCDVTDNLELKKFSNVILTPHIASATLEAREEMSLMCAKNILAVLGGKKAMNEAG